MSWLMVFESPNVVVFNNGMSKTSSLRTRTESTQRDRGPEWSDVRSTVDSDVRVILSWVTVRGCPTTFLSKGTSTS